MWQNAKRILQKLPLRPSSTSELDRLKRQEGRLRRLMDRLEIDETFFAPAYNESLLPEGAADYLHAENPRLKELQREYLKITLPVLNHSHWNNGFVDREVNLRYFRGDYAYLWQYRDLNTELHFVLTAYYLATIDRLGLYNVLEEDKFFGIRTVQLGGKIISRDLLDSILEISFLEKMIGLSQQPGVNVLDIGAGYGRLAHRLVKSLPRIGKVFCVDALPVSTFLSEYYLRFRGIGNQAEVVPLYDLESILSRHRIDLAVNIHSFSECTHQAIEGWLDLLQRYGVKYLMVVPNAESHGGTQLLSTEVDKTRIDFLPLILSKGYTLMKREPKYEDPVLQKHGLSPTHHYLFVREESA